MISQPFIQWHQSIGQTALRRIGRSQTIRFKGRKRTSLPMSRNTQKIILDCPGFRRTRRIRDHQVQFLTSLLGTYLLEVCSNHRFTERRERFICRRGSFYHSKVDGLGMSKGGDRAVRKKQGCKRRREAWALRTWSKREWYP